MHPKLTLLIVVCVLALPLACKKQSKPTEDDPTPTPTEPGPQDPVAQSAKALVRFKGDLRLARDFSAVLGLDRNELCTELGQYSCTDDVHKIGLGGVDPYEGGVYERAQSTGVTAPLIVERVAMSGCIRRVDEDFADPTGALVFRNLDVDADGRLEDVQSQVVDDAVTTLIRRSWLRDPRGNEVKHFRDLYTSLEGVDEPEPARAWATLTCVTVLTSMESLFY